MNSKNFGPNVKKYMLDNRLTNTFLAKELGMSKGSLGKILNGENQPTFENAVRICEILGIDLVPLLKTTAPKVESRAARDVRRVLETYPAMSKADLIVTVIEQDILDRRGLKSEWAAIDPEVQDEIKEHWEAIINEVLNA